MFLLSWLFGLGGWVVVLFYFITPSISVLVSVSVSVSVLVLVSVSRIGIDIDIDIGLLYCPSFWGFSIYFGYLMV